MTFFDSYTLHGGAAITIQDEGVIHSRSGTFTSAGYRLHSNGGVYKIGPGSGASTLGYDWVTPVGDAPLYEARATLNSGDSPGGIGVWYPLTSTVSWTLTATGDSLKVCELLVEIRDAATQTVRDSAIINLEAENTSL